MFIVSQFFLKNLYQCNYNSLPSYSIALGLLVYATLYIYLLFNYEEYVYIFNKFIIYFISVDLLLSLFFYFRMQDEENQMINKNDVDSDFEDHDETYDDDDDTEDPDHTEEETEHDIEIETDNEIENETEIENENDTEIENHPTPQVPHQEPQQETKQEPILTDTIISPENITKGIEENFNKSIEEVPIKRKRGRPPKNAKN